MNTSRLQKENDDRGVDNDDADFAKFEAELGVKKQALSNDMKKHEDNLSIKDKEIAIKSMQAKKTD